MLVRWKHAALPLVAILAALAVAGCGRSEEEGTALTETAEKPTSEIVSEHPVAEDETPTPSESDARLAPEREPGEVGIEEGQYPPSFSLPSLGGDEVALEDFAGKVVILDLWATWCPPCRAEIPLLISLYEEFKSDGLVVVGVGLDKGGSSVIAPFARDQGITYPVLVGDDSVHRAYRVRSIPTTFLVDRSGKIAHRHVGYHPSMADQLRAEVVALLGLDEGV
jgi:cytochrome c biogenesis protein CcmG/thiol:disulfide interchange protein DsbE